MFMADGPDFPPYTYVPGGSWPHPIADPRGHSARKDGTAPDEPTPPIARGGDAWAVSDAFWRGIALFNAGYYWEAHESWERLWHAHGRRGPTADVLKGLIKLAAAGVKARQGQRHGLVTHARRAAECLDAARRACGPRQLGLDLPDLVAAATALASNPDALLSSRPSLDAPATPLLCLTLQPR